MRLTEQEQSNLLKDFPNVELSYDHIIHKTLQSPIAVIAIPDGKKCFAWFTTFKMQNVCVLLEIAEANKRIVDIQLAVVPFHGELAYGTIFYGTLFIYNTVKYFSTEHILYYKGKDVSRENYNNKLALFKHVYACEIKQVSYSSRNVIFGLPQICADYSTLLTKLPPYKIKYIQFVSGSSTVHNLLYRNMDTFISPNPTLIAPPSHTPTSPPPTPPASTLSTTQRILTSIPQLTVPSASIPTITSINNKKRESSQSFFTSRTNSKREIVFKVKPDIQNDIYNLYYDDRNSDIFYELAYIPDYKTSVMMNTLFRNIKENGNLDALEESDDEEEFENDRIDKFVYLDRTYNIVCTYNYKFRKWVPVRVALSNQRIVTKNEIIRS